jgi:pimeloyl-ACP methyl ester carboxylesterase
MVCDVAWTGPRAVDTRGPLPRRCSHPVAAPVDRRRWVVHAPPVIPQVRFARSGGVDIAYQVLGDGPVDLVFVEGFMSHRQVMWELPEYARYCERLAEFTRLILFDKRGVGMSDRVPGATTLETRMDDIRAVMDAVGSKRAAVMGESEGGPLAILFAAAHPDRCEALILQGAELRERTDETWPWGESTDEELEAYLAGLPARWGQVSVESPRAIFPSIGPDPSVAAWLGRMFASAATPNAAEAFIRMAFEIDVRDVAPTVRVPTLILHAVEDRVCHVENARWFARNIPGARYVELPGGDHLAFFEPDAILAEIRGFLTGQREAAVPETSLVSLLFVDVVGSTERAAELGDRRWADLLTRYHAVVRDEIAQYRGREIDTAGDGFFVAFDGPARAIRCAVSIGAAVRAIGLEVRCGIHVGEIGFAGGKPVGLSVHVGARIGSLAGPGEVLVSGTVKDLVAGSGLAFTDRGTQALKGVPDEWRIFAVGA